MSVLYIGPMEAPEDAAQRLGVSAGTQVLARRRLYFRNGTPVETATSYLPWDVVKDIPELFAENPGGGGIYARLEDHGHEFTEFVETLQARPACPHRSGVHRRPGTDPGACGSGGAGRPRSEGR